MIIYKKLHKDLELEIELEWIPSDQGAQYDGWEVAEIRYGHVVMPLDIFDQKFLDSLTKDVT